MAADPAMAHAMQHNTNSSVAAMVSQEAVAEKNEKLTSLVVSLLAHCVPATNQSTAIGLLDHNGTLNLAAAGVGDMASSQAEASLIAAATPPGVVHGAVGPELRQALVGASTPVSRAAIVQSAQKSAVAAPAPLAEQAIRNGAHNDFVRYKQGAFAPGLDARQSSQFPRGTSVTAAHGLFEFQPSQLLCVHVDNLVNGYPAGTDMSARAWNGDTVSLGAHSKVDVASLCKHISTMVNLEILYFRNNGVKTLEWVKLPNLRQADFSSNLVARLDEVRQLCRNCPNLVMLNMQHNAAIATWRGPLPPQLSKDWAIAALIPRLVALNGERVPPELLANAVATYGSDEAKSSYAARLFDEAVVSAVGDLAGTPEQITELQLSAKRLSVR